jgi:hypothetical protein
MARRTTSLQVPPWWVHRAEKPLKTPATGWVTTQG